MKCKITEIFTSIQGESTYAGKPCTFIRLVGCNLRCTYCDTTYSYYGGEEFSLEDILGKVAKGGVPLVEITGGEPLLDSQTPTLAQLLLDRGYTVLIETNGSLPIQTLPKEVIKIIDVKTPDSGEGSSFLLENLNYLTINDEMKFVLSSRKDFEWAVTFLKEHSFEGTVLFSPVWDVLQPALLVEWILEEKLSVRLGLQLHKVIWDKEKRGV